MATIDHIAIPARDPESSARLLAHLLGAAVERDGPDGEFPCVSLAGARVLFSTAQAPAPHHVAFRVSADGLATAAAKLRERGIAFGNDPEDPANGSHVDPLGGAGRIYFVDPDGHLFEICA